MDKARGEGCSQDGALIRESQLEPPDQVPGLGPSTMGAYGALKWPNPGNQTDHQNHAIAADLGFLGSNLRFRLAVPSFEML